MSKPIDTLDDQLYELIESFAIEYVDVIEDEELTVSQRLLNERELIQEHKQAIKDLFSQREAEIRITCLICEKPIRYYSDLTIDHILPKSKGGTGRLDNLAPAHFHCNQKKADKLLPDLIYEKEKS